MMHEPVIRRLVFQLKRRVWTEAERGGLGPFRQKMKKNGASLGSPVLCFQWSVGSFQVRSIGENRWFRLDLQGNVLGGRCAGREQGTAGGW